MTTEKQSEKCTRPGFQSVGYHMGSIIRAILEEVSTSEILGQFLPDYMVQHPRRWSCSSYSFISQHYRETTSALMIYLQALRAMYHGSKETK
jgi:hypothetical protein